MTQTLNTQEHWAAEYIGKPWKANSRGPNSFDCYGLVWFDYLQHGIRLPLFAGVDPHDQNLVSACVEGCADTGSWVEIEKPEERCVIACSEDGKTFYHVGLYSSYKGGSIIHCLSGMAVHSLPIHRLKLFKFNALKFYKWDQSL